MAKSWMASREWALCGLCVLLTMWVSWNDPHFLTVQNLRDIAVRGAPTLIVACGVMLVVASREIDISVGSLMAALAAMLGISMSHHRANWSPALAIPLILASGAGVGWVTGAVVTWGRVPSIMVSLGMLTALRGMTTRVMGGENIDGLPATLQAATKYGWLGCPLSIWVACGVLGVTTWIVYRTPWGRQLLAAGSSPTAATVAGLSVGKLKRSAFAYTGLLTAVATVVDVPRLPKIEAGIGLEFELLVITAVVVGGVSIMGGRVRIVGVVLAVLLLTMIRPFLTFLAISEAAEKWTKAIQGGLILAAVIADRLMTKHAHDTKELG